VLPVLGSSRPSSMSYAIDLVRPSPLTAASPVCTLQGISKTYRQGAHTAVALRGVDLEVMGGELLALTGPSGSGKSTLLNICGLIDTPDQGEYRLDTRLMNRLDERGRALLRREAIGFVFQGFNLVPVMSVADNIEYPLLLSQLASGERQRRVADMLARVSLSEFAERRPDELSGGQRQRVAIARALVKRPRLVIADEPTASLDSATAEQMLLLLQELCHTEGSACLIATHDERLIARCDRCVTLRDGVLQ